MKFCIATVKSNELIAHDTREMELYAGSLDTYFEFNPGQFICLAPLISDSVMARPFSISNISTSRGTFSIIYKIVGKNTRQLSLLKPGDQIKLWGPLGKGTVLDASKYDECFLVGGGIGIAPLFFFEKVFSEYQDAEIKIFYGGRSQKELLPKLCERFTHELENVSIATDDGSVGFHGFVSDLVGQELVKNQGKKILLIACGPKVMMKKIAELSRLYNQDCYVILEKIMACGIGVCLGCSIKTGEGQKCVCKDGPVFNAEEVNWDEK